MSLIEKQANYTEFYNNQGLDTEKIIQKNSSENFDFEGYLCVCTFCLNNRIRKNNTCDHSCCKTGVLCELFGMDNKQKDKYKKVSLVGKR